MILRRVGGKKEETEGLKESYEVLLTCNEKQKDLKGEGKDKYNVKTEGTSKKERKNLERKVWNMNRRQKEKTQEKIKE